MFSSNPNANLPSSNYLHCAPLFAGYENGDVLLDPLTGLILPAANHHSLTNMAFTGSNMTRVINAEHYDLTSNFIRNKKPAVKKDRHSKIFTAKGLRDRRVRLSIEIAREFFDLQDMLGFDKASKTLEWLLNKSKMAIKELADQRKSPRNDGELQEATGTGSRSKQLEGISEERKIMEKLTKESRDKARARARRRTREKLCKKIADTSPHQILTQFRSLSQIKGTCEESSSYIVAHQVQEPCSHTQANQAPTQRKQYPSSNFAYDQQNLEISKDIIGCNTSNNNSNLAQNWNIISAMPMPQCSTFRAITKHESFKW